MIFPRDVSLLRSGLSRRFYCKDANRGFTSTVANSTFTQVCISWTVGTSRVPRGRDTLVGRCIPWRWWHEVESSAWYCVLAARQLWLARRQIFSVGRTNLITILLMFAALRDLTALGELGRQLGGNCDVDLASARLETSSTCWTGLHYLHVQGLLGSYSIFVGLCGRNGKG